jgi:hypothetical protein
MNWKRIGYGAVSVISGTILGAFAGGAVLARLLATDAGGFDAIADAIGYAMLGAVVTFTVLLYLAGKSALPLLRRLALILGISALTLVGLLFWLARQEATSGDPTAPLRPRTQTGMRYVDDHAAYTASHFAPPGT